MEIYVARCGPTHITTPVLGWGNLVAYLRNEDGTFTAKILPLDYTNQEYRDPNISISRDGSYAILTATRFDGTTPDQYKTCMWILTSTLSILGGTTFIITDIGANYFGWGNTLVSPTGHVLKSAYTTASNGVSLFQSASTVSTAPGVFTNKLDIFPASTSDPCEGTIAYWGDKLVAIARQNNGNMVYRETYDLEGLVGWSDIITLNINGVAPCLEPYVAKNEPLILSYTDTSNRNVCITATWDAINWSYGRNVDIEGGSGGYSTLVKNRFGYGVMYYQDIGTGLTQTTLWLKDIDINRYLNDLPQLENTCLLKNNLNMINTIINNDIIIGYLMTDGVMGGYGLGTSFNIKFKKDTVINGIYTLLKSMSATLPADAKITIYDKSNNIIVDGSVTSVTTLNTSVKPSLFKLSITPTTLLCGIEYKILINGDCVTYRKNCLQNTATDFILYSYLSSAYNTVVSTITYVPIAFSLS